MWNASEIVKKTGKYISKMWWKHRRACQKNIWTSQCEVSCEKKLQIFVKEGSKLLGSETKGAVMD